MIDILYALAEQIVCRLLAADATRAEHRNLLVVEPVFVGFPPGGEFSEALRARVDRPVKGANGNFVVVAGVDDRDIIAVYQVVPVRGSHIVASTGRRIDIGLAHSNDLTFEPDLHLAEWGCWAGAFFPLQISTAGQGADM